MATLNDFNTLSDKIADAQIRLAEIKAALPQVEASLADPNGSCQNQNTSVNLNFCEKYRNIVKAWKQEISDLEQNIPIWQNQLNNLSNDPAIIDALASAKLKRQLIWFAVVVVVIAISVFIYLRWKK